MQDILDTTMRQIFIVLIEYYVSHIGVIMSKNLDLVTCIVVVSRKLQMKILKQVFSYMQKKTEA